MKKGITVKNNMKYIGDLFVDNIFLNVENLQHQLYIIAASQCMSDIAQKIKDAEKVRVRFFTCMDDCSGWFHKTKVAVYVNKPAQANGNAARLRTQSYRFESGRGHRRTYERL